MWLQISVYILGCSVIAIVATLYKGIGLCWSKENLRKLMNEDAKFVDMEQRYKNATMKDAMIWELPFEQYHIVNSAKGISCVCRHVMLLLFVRRCRAGCVI